MDFNTTFFAHPKAADGFTLAHRDPAIRRFWVEHGIACRKIGEAIGRRLGQTCVTNHLDSRRHEGRNHRPQAAPRVAQGVAGRHVRPAVGSEIHLDAVESKLFGIGSETYVPGSFEFYLAYALTNRKLLTLDTGHFHPTETIIDKISAILLFTDEILLHVSRGIRWDSDHVVIFNDELRAIAEELIRGGFLDRVHIGLDYFDASINRVAAWVIGMRAMIKALLAALLEPTAKLRQLELAGDYTSRLAMLEQIKTLPLGDVWNYYCLKHGVPLGPAWLAAVKQYEKDVTSKR